ncbi:UV-damage endonuclease [Bacillus sp. OV322]|uniref:UV DNA damage repair endonuclease UvsE n=1 Tax=Bacillus sp. OV322 TaxID=1882764 RepID=UPI0008E40674|nr:UV DNA damage repair endonuclease UvsE [Bacillus sp. OV322]SFC20966.1 UV-damage endonuclease [Bacillus sp. OV322]
MKIRFGYVANATLLWDASPAKSLTFKRFSELGKDERINKLHEVTLQNIENTRRILLYNAAHQIEVYRLSSSIVPLATHPEVQWDFVAPFKKEWEELGSLIKQYGMRVSFHPNQFTLFTSSNPVITANAVKDMVFHYEMLNAMGVEKESVINIHVGGAYGDKAKATARFYENIAALPLHVKQQMTLENDDKTYTADETLKVCQNENIRMVFDYHHYMANQGEKPFGDLLPDIFATWEHTGLIPKIHVSSPKNEKEFRSHSDFVDLEFLMPLIKALRTLNQDVDFMIEAKKKDQAMLKLVDDISKIRGVKRISGGSAEWK